MAKRIMTVAAIWTICGFYTWGTTIATFCGEFPETKPRDHYGIAATECLIGPIGVVVAALQSNFNQHGWRLR